MTVARPDHPAQICTLPTPIGPFTVIASPTEEGLDVLASGWTDDPMALLSLIAPGLRPTHWQQVPSLNGTTAAVAAYHDGEIRAIDDIPVRQSSGAFSTASWAALRTVAPGVTVTYTELARRSGNPAAVRAAASACARNAVALFVPCHRIVRTDGSMGGFRWGVPVKRWLLDHEAAHRT